jgi:hypothetical protein
MDGLWTQTQQAWVRLSCGLTSSVMFRSITLSYNQGSDGLKSPFIMELEGQCLSLNLSNMSAKEVSAFTYTTHNVGLLVGHFKVGVHIHTFIHTYIHTYMRTYIRTYIHTYVHTYVRTYVHTCVRTYIRAYMHTCVHAYMRTCIQTDRQTD